MKPSYTYLGDRLCKIWDGQLTSPWAGQPCQAVLRADGKCIRGRNSNMLVQFPCGTQVVVPARMLRKLKAT